MTEMTTESIIGVNAGIVWEALNQNGQSSIINLVRYTSLGREDIYCALGWLGRENKILVAGQGKARVFSLRP